MFESGEVLILSGIPGSGKTTAAQILTAQPGCPKVHLHSDDFWHLINMGAISPYLAEAHCQNTVVMKVLAHAAAGYAAGGYFVLVDGIIGPWFLDAFRSITVPLHYVVLRQDLMDALRRCRERGGDTLSDPEPIRALHQQFTDLGDFARHILPVEGMTRAIPPRQYRARLPAGPTA